MLSRFSVRRPYTVFVAVVVIIVFGIIGLVKMVPELFPNVDMPFAVVMTAYPGASPEEAEQNVTEPLEQQLATMPNVKNMTSISDSGFSVVQMEFSDDVDMDTVSVDIREKIGQIQGTLPEDAAEPVVMKINMDMMMAATAAVGMEGKSSGEVSAFVRENLENPLKGIEGVASVSIMGMTDDDLTIVLSKDKIKEVNDRISAAVSGQLADARGQINRGISEAESGKQKIKEGKEALTEGQKQAARQMSTMKERLKSSREELTALKELNKNYLMYRNDPVRGPALEAQIKAMGMTPESLAAAAGKADSQIKSIDRSLADLELKGSLSAQDMSNKYADLSAAQSTAESAANQLQMSLAELEGQEEAALSSADMTGVLTMQNITAILKAQNFSMPAGYVTDGDAEVLVSVGDRIKSRDEMENLVLFDMGIKGVEPVRLKDVATVSYSGDEISTYARINGDNGVLMSFGKQSDYSASEVSENIKDRFASLEDKHEGLKFTMLMDQGEYINIVISSVLKNLLLGALLAILILIVFLRDIRPTVITAVSIPLSVIFAVVLMYFTGVSINMISLAGLAIGVGMLVDNSIVVMENIYRLRSLGYSKVQSAVSGAVQVAGAIASSTLTTICVFIPIIFVDGMTKDMFTDIALTVTYSLLASLVIALTLVPAMSKELLNKAAAKTVLSQNGRFIKRYRKVAGWCLGHRKIIVTGAVVMLVLSTGLALMRGFAFMPAMSTPQISATIQMDRDSTLEETSEKTDRIIEEVRKIDGVKTVGGMLASDTMGMMGMSFDGRDVTSTALYIILDEEKVENGKLIAEKLDEMEKEYDCEIITSADMDMLAMAGISDVSITLYSDDLDLLRKTGSRIESSMGEMKALDDISSVDEESTNELKITVNKNLAMEHGLTVAQVYQQISAILDRNDDSTAIRNGSHETDVVVENTSSEKFTRADLENIELTAEGKDGKTEKVKLTSVADISSDAALDTINHDEQKRCLKVTAAVKDGYNVTHASDAVQKMIEEKDLIPDGVKLEYSGENEEIMDSMVQMLFMMLVGFILVYLVMVAQFQSLRSPFIIIFTVPLAITGGMIALFICGRELSVVSMMGFVMLMGVVVNNAIVLVDCINRFRLEGMAMDEAIINAGAVRMRPVIMTAVTTVLGLLPVAVGAGTGAEMMQPVAMVCIGGLIYGTITTLVVIPVMYRIFGKRHMEKIAEEELEIVTV